jgi:hypothetical protein
MLRHMVHAGVIVADFTTQVVSGDGGPGNWLLVAGALSVMFSAYGLARDCSAGLFAPPSDAV